MMTSTKHKNGEISPMGRILRATTNTALAAGVKILRVFSDWAIFSCFFLNLSKSSALIELIPESYSESKSSALIELIPESYSES